MSYLDSYAILALLKAHDRVAVSAPPRSGKSTVAFEIMAGSTAKQILYVSYSREFAERKCRDLNLPNVTCGGVCDTALAGRGFDLLVVDSAYRSQIEATSTRWQAQVEAHLRDVVLTRQSPNARVLYIDNRWHKDDTFVPLTQWGFVHVNFPTEVDEDRRNYLRDMLGTDSFNTLYLGLPT